ncbi:MULTISPECIES: DUF6400 family protein [unclassified Streptomyces]|uniref:DUF6400 family protein n=1 Tax=unclassified Streptomyces TaxID=2593676 RepID=UPI0033E6898F
MNHNDSPDQLHTFELDFTEHETARRAEVVAALGDDWDPVEVLRGEDEAHRLLYSGLDEEQEAVHRMLVAAGVLPAREETGKDDGAASD